MNTIFKHFVIIRLTSQRRISNFKEEIWERKLVIETFFFHLPLFVGLHLYILTYSIFLKYHSVFNCINSEPNAKIF